MVRAVAHGIRGSADLIAYMFLTAASLCDRDRGGFGLIATNSIAQGRTREVGLDQIAAAGFGMYAAVKSEKWPTKGANLEYSIIWASRHPWSAGVRADLDGLRVQGITPSLDAISRATGNPHRLMSNADVCFQGANIMGLGFTMSRAEADELIDRDARNAEVLFSYVNGDDLNNRPDSSGSRWVIDFFDWPEDRAKNYPDCYEIVRLKVKPARDRNKRETRRKYWWRYEPAPALREAIAGLSHVLVITRVSKVVMPVRVRTGQVFSEQCVVFATSDLADLTLLSSSIHYCWAIVRASTLETRIRYTSSDVFETLPRPTSTDRMRAAGDALDRDRRDFMLDRQLGLTKTYNLVHDPAVADTEVAHLRGLHVEVDEAVRAAYGWDDLSLGHGHHDTRQGVRWTISPSARLELLDRLLELNHKRFADEQAASCASHVRRKRRKSAAQTGDALFDTDEDA